MNEELLKKLRNRLFDIEVILNHLSVPGHVAGSDGEHLRALMCSQALDKTRESLDLLEQGKD
ncbi:hypothetical protein [uncultured Marinobacter sp.]|uniref:hypothetical protein n=1 Tax=uncultured Marinobacter sp. TaxID=187379 RepID=UPI00258FF701|nr:hypothetical protein [uncultured Marinobacter sp.]